MALLNPSTYPPDVKYSDYFVKFAREARDANKGLWYYGQNGTTKGELDPNATVVNNGSSTGSSGKSSGGGSTTSSGGKEFFANYTELRKKYPNGVPSNDLAYQTKMDRDYDNYACER